LPNGAVMSLTVLGSNILAGTSFYGVFLSGNNGSSWISINAGLPSGINTYAFAISGSYLFVGGSSSGGNGVWRRSL
jgi:hypothetical protein